jgi:hypothetical protein
MERNVIQQKGKSGKFTQFSQSCECRDVRQLLIAITRNRVKYYTERGEGWRGYPGYPIPRVPKCP